MRRVHGAKADATSAGANSTSDQSATMEPTCLEAAAAVETTIPEVSATTKPTATESSTATTVSRRPCYGTQRHGCDTDY
jgi:hypothetical protein